MTPAGARRLRLAATTKAAGHRSVLVTAQSSVRYLSGFTGSAGALWIPLEDPPVLVTDFRYEEQAGFEVADPIRTHISREGWIRGVAEVAADADGPTVFEAEGLTVADYESLRGALPDMTFVPHRDLILTLRRVKSRDEVDAIERAIAVAEGAFDRLLSTMEWSAAPSEREIAAALEGELRVGGSDSLPFDPIVAAGQRSALPHATPTDRRLESGDLLLIDFGARVDGYCSDITRTCIRGTPEPWQVTLHERVLEAQSGAREVIGGGVACRDVDEAVRASFARHDMGRFLRPQHGARDRTRRARGAQPLLAIRRSPGAGQRGDSGTGLVSSRGAAACASKDDVRITEAGARTLTRLFNAPSSGSSSRFHNAIGDHGRYFGFSSRMVIELKGTLYSITYFQHVKPGKGGAFVRTKLKDVMEGGVNRQDLPCGREGQGGSAGTPARAVQLHGRPTAPPS